MALAERQKPEVVFHLAAQSSVSVSVADPMLDAEVNVLGSVNVLEAARAAGSRKVVYAASGGTIYGDVDPRDLPSRRATRSARSRRTASRRRSVTDYLTAYRELHQLEFTSLALANVYGPRQDPHGEAGVVSIFAGAPAVQGSRARSSAPATTLATTSSSTTSSTRSSGRRRREAACSQHRHRPRDLGQLSCTRRWRPQPSVTATAAARSAAGRVSSPGPSLDPGRAEIHLGWKPWTTLEAGTAAVLDWLRASRP